MPDRYAVDAHKLHYHPDRVCQLKYNPLECYPVYVEISPTSACNHRCKFCALDFIGYERIRLHTAKIKNVLLELSSLGVRSVMYAGEGEPLLHPDLEYITEFSKYLSINSAVNTNGVPLTEKRIYRLLPTLTFIRFSINAGDKDTYDLIHRPKPRDFDRVIHNLRTCARLTMENAWPVTIGVQSLVLPDNIGSLPKLAEIVSEIGVDYLILKPYSQHTGSITHEYEDRTLSIKEHRALEARLLEYSTPKTRILYRMDTIFRGMEPRTYEYCKSVPYVWSYISSKGGVYGCSAHLHNPEFCYGNVYENKFKRIWLGSQRQRAMRSMVNFNIDACRKMCRMDSINEYLWRLDHPQAHDNFI